MPAAAAMPPATTCWIFGWMGHSIWGRPAPAQPSGVRDFHAPLTPGLIGRSAARRQTGRPPTFFDLRSTRPISANMPHPPGMCRPAIASPSLAHHADSGNGDSRTGPPVMPPAKAQDASARISWGSTRTVLAKKSQKPNQKELTATARAGGHDRMGAFARLPPRRKGAVASRRHHLVPA